MVGQLPDLLRSVDVKLRFFRVALQETLDQDESTRVFTLFMIRDLVRREIYFVTFSYLQLSCKIDAVFSCA